MIFRSIFQSALRGSKTKFLIFFSYGHPQQKVVKGQESFRYGLPKDILGKRKKNTTGRTAPPPPLHLRLNISK